MAEMNETRQGKRSLTLTILSDKEIKIERVFDAPMELVFKAYTDPDLVPRWWGLKHTTTIVDKMDVRPGGLWRYVERSPDGSEDAFRGEYREVVPPNRLVYTFEWEGMPGHVSVDAITFEEQDGQTKMTAITSFASVEDRDGMLQTGMEAGANEGYDQLDGLLGELMKTQR
jgi:uncharacterized protein YndB with AHSA1/START domain